MSKQNKANPQRLTHILIGGLVALLCLTFVQTAHPAVPNIPPSVLAELQTMSPSEQVALAREYGFDLPTNDSYSVEVMQDDLLGRPGKELEMFERAERMQVERAMTEQTAKFKDGEAAELKRFGLELFDLEVSTFSPVDDMPIPESYPVGPGDSFNIFLYGNEELDLSLSVNRDGLLLLPRLGPLHVAGLTLAEVKEIVGAKVATQLVGTKAVVSFGKLRAMNVYLAGDVKAPGSYSVSGLATTLQVLFAGGGVSDIGSLRNIQVKRHGKTVAELDTYDILLRGDTSGDIRLVSGDTIFVPTVERLVTVDGEVKRPAIYELDESEDLGDLIDMAGGLSAYGYAKSASLKRPEKGGSNAIRLQVNLADKQDLKTELSDGDSLFVAAIKDEVVNQVVLRGAVARPGGYEWFPGQRVSDLLGSLDEDLLDETDISTGLVLRRTGDGLEIEALSLDLENAIENSGGTEDLILQPKDELLVFALPYLNDSYQALIEAADEPGDVPMGFDRFEQYEMTNLNTITEAEPLKGEGKDFEKGFEDRSDLIEQAVFRLEAQAKAPSDTRVIEVSGDVRLPGKYPLLQDRSIEALISLAGGFANSAFLGFVEVTRTNFKSQGEAFISSIKVPLKGSSDYKPFLLEPLDQIRVSRIPNWSYGNKVEINGSVAFPGTYPIVQGERLSSLIERAGGLNPNAFAEGSVLIKVEAQKRERAQLEQMINTIQRASLAEAQTRERETSPVSGDIRGEIQLLKSMLESEATGRVVIDLPAILRGDQSADIKLESGDSLTVPEFNNTVSVLGEVRKPGTFIFESNRSLSDYIEEAAGNTVRADEKETYVVRANGSIDYIGGGVSLLSFKRSDQDDLRPGDTIVVPVNEEYLPLISRYKEVSTVVFQSVASLYPLFRL